MSWPVCCTVGAFVAPIGPSVRTEQIIAPHQRKQRSLHTNEPVYTERKWHTWCKHVHFLARRRRRAEKQDISLCFYLVSITKALIWGSLFAEMVQRQTALGNAADYRLGEAHGGIRKPDTSFKCKRAWWISKLCFSSRPQRRKKDACLCFRRGIPLIIRHYLAEKFPLYVSYCVTIEKPFNLFQGGGVALVALGFGESTNIF